MYARGSQRGRLWSLLKKTMAARTPDKKRNPLIFLS
jgi:hypothetical protein